MSARWAFSNGCKIVDGRRIAAMGTVNYLSSTNGNTLYTVTRWSDGTSSCNCPGWTQRGRYTCKHVEGRARPVGDIGFVAPAKPVELKDNVRIIGEEE